MGKHSGVRRTPSQKRYVVLKRWETNKARRIAKQAKKEAKQKERKAARKEKECQKKSAEIADTTVEE